MFEWECPECGKKVESLYPEQFTFNVMNHLRIHYNPTTEEYQETFAEVQKIIKKEEEE